MSMSASYFNDTKKNIMKASLNAQENTNKIWDWEQRETTHIARDQNAEHRQQQQKKNMKRIVTKHEMRWEKK